MGINLTNFLASKSQDRKMKQFQDLDHLDGLAMSSVSANLYDSKRDDLAMFYFRDGANFASVYTQSKILSENIKWNLNQKAQKIFSLIINTRNANSFTGEQGYKSIQNLADMISKQLTEKQKIDEEEPKIVKPKNLIFGCTGTIGERYPEEKIKLKIPDLIKNIKYTQNKYIWIKAALAIMTTDTQPKIAMEECKIGKTTVKIYGIAKGSGMIYPNMATTLGYIFTDATLSSSVLNDVLKNNIKTTFNAISCDGDTSTNDMVSIFSTSKVSHPQIKKHSDSKLKNFNKALHDVLLNLAKQVVSDGEGASKFISISCINCKTEKDAKNISFKIANSLLVKTAIAGEDPNWGRVAMAVGNSDSKINERKLSISFGPYRIFHNGSLYKFYDEKKVMEYMKGQSIEIEVDIGQGVKKFKSFTMDLTKKYIEINADYRT